MRTHIQLHSTVSASIETRSGTSPDMEERAQAYGLIKQHLVAQDSDGLRNIYPFGRHGDPLPCGLHGTVVRRFQRWHDLGTQSIGGFAQPLAIDLLNNEQLATLARKSFHTGRSVQDLLSDMRPDFLGGYDGTFVGTTPSGYVGSLDSYGDFNT